MDTLLPFISGHLPDGGLYYATLFLIAMSESIAMIGLAVPGSTLIVLAGFLTAHGQGHLTAVMAAAGSGALTGDFISYWMGARLGYRFLRRPFFRKYLGAIRKAELFFLDHGGKSLFLGRFAGPLRGLTPFMAGTGGFPLSRFSGYTLISCLLWGLAYPGLGKLGAASWRQVQVWSGRFSLLMTTLVIVLFLNALFWRRMAPRLSARLATGTERIRQRWLNWLQTPLPRKYRESYPRTWNFLADRFCLRHGAGFYLTCGFFFCVLFAGLVFTLLSKLPLLEATDHRIYALVTDHYQPVAGRVLLIVSGLADRPVLILWGLLLLFWMLLKGRNFSAAVVLAGTCGGQALISSLKWFFDRPRPHPLHPALELHSPAMPSGHAFFALLLGGLTIYLMLGTIRRWQSRLSLISGFSFMVLLIGLSRIFTGAHWFSDVLAGWLLAALWLSFLITALEIRKRLAGETLLHRQWQSPGFDRRLEKVLWATAAGLVLLGVAQHLLSLWRPG
jgi:undecaprenyl-diphosphatase